MVRHTLSSIRNLLTKEQNEIISTVSILMVLSLVTKLVGMVFLSLVARQFGASRETDLFYLASAIPETITNIILLGAVSGAIIPIFVKVREKEGEDRFKLAFSSTMNLAMLSFIALSILAAIFARELVPFATELVQQKKPLTPEEINKIVEMMRLMLIPQIVLGFSAFVSTGLNIYERFIIPQLGPLFFNVGRIIGIMIIVPMMGGSIWGLVWGTLLGSVLHLLIQIPLLRHLNFNFKLFWIDFKDNYFRQVIKLGLPRMLSLGVEQIASIVDTLIAFGLVAGSLTAYQLAVRLVSIPLNLFGATYSIAAFPTLAKLYTKVALEEFSILFHKILNQVFFLAIPVTVLLLVLRVPIVRLAYGILGGNFSWDDTRQVAWVVLFFAIGLSFETMRSAIFRFYYAMHDSITPFVSSVFVVIGGIITGILFTNYFSHFSRFAISELTFDISYFFTKGNGLAGVGGLGLSSSVIFSVEAIVLIFILQKRGILKDPKGLIISISKKLLAGLVMLITAYAMMKLWDQVLDTARTFQLIILTSTTIAAAFMVYVWTSFVLKIPEVELFINFIARGLKKILPRSLSKHI